MLRTAMSRTCYAITQETSIFDEAQKLPSYSPYLSTWVRAPDNFEFVNLDTNDATAGQWEIFGTLMNGGTLLIRTSNWEEVLKRVSEPCLAPDLLSSYFAL